MYFWTRNHHGGGKKVNLRQKSFTAFANYIVRALGGTIGHDSFSTWNISDLWQCLREARRAKRLRHHP